jgi:predicted nucleotidyltransferase
MRLTHQQAETIRKAAQAVFGPGTRVVLFGSRVDDSRRGGDIDLLIQPETHGQTLTEKIRFLGILERELGERKVDVVIEQPGDSRPIVRVAHEMGVAL